MRGDKLISMKPPGSRRGAIIAVPRMLFVSFPRHGCIWPFLLASPLFNHGYNTVLALSYHHGEPHKVSPLVLGSAPLATHTISLSSS
jgi:hypothetical protein